MVNDIKGLSHHRPLSTCPNRTAVSPHRVILIDAPPLVRCLGQWLLNQVRYMERKRKERRKIKAYNDNIDEEPIALDTLFSQEEEISDSHSNVWGRAAAGRLASQNFSPLTREEIDRRRDSMYSVQQAAGFAQTEESAAPIDDPNIMLELDEISSWTPSDWTPHLITTPPRSPHISRSPPPIIRRNAQWNSPFFPAPQNPNPRIGGLPPYVPRQSIRTNLINSRDNLINNSRDDTFHDIFRDMVMQVIQEENQLSNID